MRALKITGAAAACLLAIIIVLLVTGIPSAFITSHVQDRIERDFGYRIAINGKTGIVIWPSFSLALHNVTLETPRNGAAGAQLLADKIRVDLPLASLLSGSPKASELVVDHPMLRLPMLRERTRTDASPRSANENASTNAPAFPIDRVTITNGTMVFFDPDNHREDRVDNLSANVAVGADGQIDVTGSSQPGSHSLKFTIKAAPLAGYRERQSIPTELTLDFPDLNHKLTARADVGINGRVVLIDDLSGQFDDGPFNGWASVDFAGKPLVKIDLDFQRLSFDFASNRPAAQSSAQLWSDAPIDTGGLNYVDAQLKVSAAELNIGEARLAPASVEATIVSGILNASFSNFGAYDGKANGTLSINATTDNPSYALDANVAGVRALPLLSGLAGFDNVDGTMQAKADFQSTGASLRAIMSNLDGTMSADVRDGAIRNLNIAKMIRTLTSGTLSGWQERPDETTDLSQLSATARVAQGQVTISVFFLIGPLVRMTGAGTVDLASRTLAFRVEPKLVMTTQGQGGSADAVGLGIPVIVQGTWSEPRIYPDVSGILDNPDAAYARLRELGQGLFGPSGTGAADNSNTELDNTLGKMIQQGLGAGAGGAPAGQPTPLDNIMKRLFGR